MCLKCFNVSTAIFSRFIILYFVRYVRTSMRGFVFRHVKKTCCFSVVMDFTEINSCAMFLSFHTCGGKYVFFPINTFTKYCVNSGPQTPSERFKIQH